LIRILFFIAFLSLSGPISAQQLYSGIIVDSTSLTNLPDVHVSVKHKGKITSTATNGSFMIYASTMDTLVFSGVGYITSELPLFFAENTIFIMMREDRIFLNEIIIKSTRLYPNKIQDRINVAPRTMSSLDGFISPITYFSQLEREKRKLFRVIEENNRTQTFRQVITDPDVKSILMNDYEVSEEIYYHLIENFNMQHAMVHYFNDPDSIMEALHSFFAKELAGK